MVALRAEHLAQRVRTVLTGQVDRAAMVVLAAMVLLARTERR